jgi:uncharacterized protein (UPF0335 family)
MNLIKHLKENWLIYLLMIVTITLVIMQLSGVDYYSKYTINRLEEENRKISNKNNILLNQLDSLGKENKILDASIVLLVKEDSLLRYQLDSLNKKINIIRSLYEKAKIHPNNFNSDSLLWYFSKL